MSATNGQASKLDQIVAQAMEQFKVPGMAVGILHEGVIGAHGYGTANIETNQPVTPDTIFQIGSISKIFTTTTVMTFVDEGKLDLDTPVVEYLPDLEFSDPEAGNAITLRLLLSHQSGIFGDHFTDYGQGDDALQKGMADVKTLRQLTKPGELWTYCNLGFDIAGAIIEKISGQRFEDVVHERVLKPIGMEHTFYTAQEVITYPHAVGHNPVKPGADEVEVAHRWWLNRWIAPPGGISSIVADMLLFAQCHMNEGKAGDTQVLSAKSTAAMQEPQTAAGNFAESYGIGWAIDTIDGVKAVSHGGSTNGFNAHLDLIPGQHFAICTLTNSSRGSAAYRQVIRWALQEYCGLTSRDPETISLPDDRLKVYAGNYTQERSSVGFKVEDGGLVATMRSNASLEESEDGEEKEQEESKVEEYPPMTMKPIGNDAFLVVGGDADGSTVEFIPGEGEHPRFVRFGGRLLDREK